MLSLEQPERWQYLKKSVGSIWLNVAVIVQTQALLLFLGAHSCFSPYPPLNPLD